MVRADLLILSVCLAAGVSAAPPSTLTVSAALSLTEVMEELAAIYTSGHGTRIRFNFAASNVLARQIVHGAPVDVFLSADEAQMDLVTAAGRILPGSRVDVVGNRLAIVTAPDRVEAVRQAFPRASPGIRRLAIGDPAAVPAGVYARAYLERQGLWERFERRIVPTANVRAALAAVQNRSADVAIVYVTDVRHARDAALALIVEPADGPSIRYPAAVVASTRQREEALRFLAFLRGAEAQGIFLRHQFVPLPAH